MLRAYFQAAASIFEPDRAAERLAWARTAVIAEAVSLHLRGKASDVSTRVHGAISELENHGRDALTRLGAGMPLIMTFPMIRRPNTR